MHTADTLTAALRVREDALEGALGEYQEAIDSRVSAELQYEMAKAKSGLLCDQTNDVKRKAWVMVQVSDEYADYRIAEALESAAKAAYFVAQTKAQNGVSLLALHRTEMQLAASPLRV
jgi:hypothetical protein